MSASRDHTQNATFIFSSFYGLYQKAKTQSANPSDLTKGVVLKTSDIQTVSQDDQAAFSSWARNETSTGKKNLASHLLELRQARKKLSFMIQEMDELLKRSS
jgi:hypothetical protein